MSHPNRHLAAEMATQPEDWLRAAARATREATLLPSSGETVAVVGCGTSWYVAQAYAAMREQRGQGITDAWPASEYRPDRVYDRLLVVTRSGTTTEVLELLSSTDSWTQRPPVTALLADPSTPVASLVDDVIVLDDVDEESVVQTRFATTALALLRAHLGDDLRPAVTAAREALRGSDSDVLGPLLTAEQVTFLGRGWTVGLAHEAALKLRESAQAWTEAYPAMEYRHGPISIAGPGRVTWALGEVPDGLPDEVRATGAHFEHRAVDPLAEMVRVHRLCLVRARAAGLDADAPRHLSRSIILT